MKKFGAFNLDHFWNFPTKIAHFLIKITHFIVLREKVKGVANNELQNEARVFPQLAEFLIELVTP